MAKKRFHARKRFVVWLSLLTFIIVGAGLSVKYIAPYAIVQPPHYELEEHKDHFPEGYLPTDYGFHADEIQLNVADSVDLHGYYLHQTKMASRGCFVLLHGIGGCKEHFFSLAGKLLDEGFDVCIVDHRGHGQSTGEYISYGYHEKHDVVALLNYLQSDYGHERFAVWGNSYGGAVALQAGSIDHRIDLLVVESTFNHLDQVVNSYQKRLLGISSKRVSDYVLNRAASLAQFDPNKVRPAEAAKSITAPVFLAHGEQDERIPFASGQEIFVNLASKQKVFHPVKGGHHSDLWAKGGEDYEKSIFAFINSNW